MSRAAKFRGTCQACGKLHKLPGGVLSKHGYRVVWNSFWNVCPGAGRAAFEEQKSLVEELIVSVKGQVLNLKERIEEVPNEDFVILTGRGDRDRYYRRAELSKQVPLNEVRVEPWSLEWNDPDDDDRLYSFQSYGGDAIEKCKARRVALFESEIRGAEQYIKWQEDRLEGWEPKELIPLEVKVEAKRKWFEDCREAYREERILKEAGHKVRTRRDRYSRGATLYDYGKEEVT